MTRRHGLGFTITLAAPLLLSAPLLGTDLPFPGRPTFEVLLQGEPIVVVGQVLKKSGAVSRVFQSPDMEEPVTVLFDDYAFRAVEVLKGQLPDPFVVRVLAARQQDEPAYAPGVSVLLVLAPDVNEGAGTYAISHEGAYPVVDDAVEVTTAQGAETWTLQQVRDELARIEERRAQRLAESPEAPDPTIPPAAATEVPPGAAEELPAPSEVERSPGLTPPEELTGAEPMPAQGPAAELPPEGPKVPWLWILLLVLVLLVILAWRRRA